MTTRPRHRHYSYTEQRSCCGDCSSSVLVVDCNFLDLRAKTKPRPRPKTKDHKTKIETTSVENKTKFKTIKFGLNTKSLTLGYCHFLDLRTRWPNHTTLELVACLAIVVRFSLAIAGEFRHYASSSPAAMALCILIDGGTLQSIGMNGGVACVVVITLDRYWKIVHQIHHRKYYRRWMLHVGLFLPWLNGAAVHLFPSSGTSRIVNGVCRPTQFWPTEAMVKVRSAWFFIGCPTQN